MAVYTHLSQSDIDQFIANYDIGKLQTVESIIKGVSNSNYLLTLIKDGVTTKYILTLFEARTDVDDLPFCFALTAHLVKKNFPCPQPLTDKRGNIINQCKDKAAVIISFLLGCEKSNWDENDCFAAGQKLAAMHLASQDFLLKRQNKLSLPGWENLWQACQTKLRHRSPALDSDINELEQHFTAVKKMWVDVPATLPVGACHADFFPDNVFFESNNTSTITGVIDFYFACTDRLAYDLAITMTAWCFIHPNGMLQKSMAEKMLAGYQTLRPLTADEKKYFIHLLVGAAWRFTLTRFYDMHNHQANDLVKPKDPSFYWAMLRWLLDPTHHSIIKNLL